MDMKKTSYLGIIVGCVFFILFSFYNGKHYYGYICSDITKSMLYDFWGNGIGNEILGLSYSASKNLGLLGWLSCSLLLIFLILKYRYANGRRVIKIFKRLHEKV